MLRDECTLLLIHLLSLSECCLFAHRTCTDPAEWVMGYGYGWVIKKRKLMINLD